MSSPFDLISLPAVFVALIVVNLIAFAAFGLDKAKAQAGSRRISEASLLQLAFMGGTIGAYAQAAVFQPPA